MNKIKTIINSLLLQQEDIAKLIDSPNWSKQANLITFFVGIYYGIVNIVVNYSFIASFDSDIFRVYLVPLFFIIGGIAMIFVTRFGLTLFVWAGVKGMGGTGLIGIIYRLTGFALIPTVVAIPNIIAISQGDQIGILAIILITFSLIWIYFYMVNAMKTLQKFKPWKAYTSVFLAFLFLTSMYYITIPV